MGSRAPVVTLERSVCVEVRVSEDWMACGERQAWKDQQDHRVKKEGRGVPVEQERKARQVTPVALGTVETAEREV